MFYLTMVTQQSKGMEKFVEKLSSRCACHYKSEATCVLHGYPGGERDGESQLHDQSPQTSSGWWHCPPASFLTDPPTRSSAPQCHILWGWEHGTWDWFLSLCVSQQKQPQTECREYIYFFYLTNQGIPEADVAVVENTTYFFNLWFTFSFLVFKSCCQ